MAGLNILEIQFARPEKKDALATPSTLILNNVINVRSMVSSLSLIRELTNQTTPMGEVFKDAENDILYMMDIYPTLVYWPIEGISSLTNPEPKATWPIL